MIPLFKEHIAFKLVFTKSYPGVGSHCPALMER